MKRVRVVATAALIAVVLAGAVTFHLYLPNGSRWNACVTTCHDRDEVFYGSNPWHGCRCQTWSAYSGLPPEQVRTEAQREAVVWKKLSRVPRHTRPPTGLYLAVIFLLLNNLRRRR